LDIEMIPSELPPQLTGGRMERFLAIVKNAPRDPSCGCLKLGETAMLLIRAIIDEQKKVDIEIGVSNGSSENTDKQE
jgi:hypothetical protein